MEQGPQGGYHIWVNVRLAGLHPGYTEFPELQTGPNARFELTLDTGRLIGETGWTFADYELVPGGMIDMEPIPVVLRVNSMAEVQNRFATLAVEAEDFCGTTVRSSMMVLISPPPTKYQVVAPGEHIEANR